MLESWSLDLSFLPVSCSVLYRVSDSKSASAVPSPVLEFVVIKRQCPKEAAKIQYNNYDDFDGSLLYKRR